MNKHSHINICLRHTERWYSHLYNLIDNASVNPCLLRMFINKKTVVFAFYGACGGFHVCLYVGNKQTHTGEYRQL